MGRVKVHLDTDIGGDIDDLCALAFLVAAPTAELTGVTTVVESAGRRAGYVRYVLRCAASGDVPVAAGADVRSGSFREPEYALLDEERYWPEPISPAPGPVGAALDLLERSIDLGTVIVAVGPFTNLSLLEQRSPGMLSRATLTLMGGRVVPAPVGFPAFDHEMDFNVQADARAALHVLRSVDPERTTLVPIEVTARTALRRSHLPALEGAGPLGRLVARQAREFAIDERYEERYGRVYPGLPDDVIDFQHDPLACAVALGWDGVTIETLPLELALEDGWLRMRIGASGRRMRVVTGVDHARFDQYWLETVTAPATRPHPP